MRILLRDLSPGTKYYFQARATDNTSTSEWSRKFDIDTNIDEVAPSAPTNSNIVTAGTSAMLSWSAVTTNEDSTPIRDLAGYRIAVSSPGTPGSFMKDVGNTESFEFTLDMNRRAFGSPKGNLKFDVVAFDTVRNTSLANSSPTVSFPQIANVTGLEAVTSLGAVALKWNEVEAPTMKGYRVYTGSTSNFTPDTPIYEGTGASFMFISTETDRDHYFKVFAFDVFDGESLQPATAGPVRPEAPFVLDTEAPSAPTGLTAVINKTVMNVSWNEVDVSDLRHYIVEYRPVGGTNWSTSTVTYDLLSTAIPVAEGVNYEVRVKASDFSGNISSRSPIVTTTSATVNTAPAVPTGLAVTAGRDSLQIKWNENTEADMKNNVGTYDVTVATNSAFTTGVLQYRTGALTLSVNGLNTGTQYWTRVRATDSGNPPLSSAYSSSVAVTTGTYPSTPLSDGTAPTASPVATVTGGFGYIHASWTPITNNDLVTYEVHVGTATGFTPSSSTKVAEITGSTVIIEKANAAGADLAYATNYYVKTIAKDRDGAAAASAASGAVQIVKIATSDTTITPGTIGAATPSYVDSTYNSTLKNYTVEYSVGSSETVAPTTGWSTATPTRTAGTFIWYRTVVTYGNNTTTTTSPALLTGNTGAQGATGSQGIPGTPGADGQSLYTWIKYADTPTTGMSDTPAGKTYFGISYNKTSATESTTYSDYSWSLIKGADGQDGADGVQGPPGADGTTTYTWVKYADSAAGAGMADSPTGKTYIGLAFNKTTATESTTATDYAWSLIQGPQGPQGSQGIQGPPGANGQSLYTWLKYADTPTTGMSDSPAGKAYIGLAYNKTSSTESSTYSDYTWSLVKGEQGNQGVQGPAGADGTTTYTWVKYADNASGGGMSDSPAGKTYIGLAFNKTTATESTTTTDYQWSLIQGPQGAQGPQGNTGPAGADAKVISLTATTQVLTSPATGGTTSPATSVVTGEAVNTTITAWTYSVNGAAFSTTVPAGVSRSANVVTITGSTMTAKTIAVKMADAAGNSDTLTVAKVLDGAKGDTGNTGGTGATGAAGADAYTVILTNESQTFAGSTTAALAGSTTSGVIAYKGGTQVAATIGTITGQVTGLTTAISNNGTTTASVTVTVTTALTTKSGELTIPVTVDGKSFTKKFSWALSLQGATGSQGNPGSTGATGVSVTSVTPYFTKVTKGASAPAAPTASPPPGPWSATEPTFSLNTELYRVDRILYSNSTFSYTAVTKVSAYDGADAAIAEAQDLANTAKSEATIAAKTYTDNTKTALQTEIGNLRQQAIDAAANATNLIANPSFEQDLEGWITSGGTTDITTARSRTGTKSLAVGGTASAYSTPLSVTAGETYRLGLYVWAISTTGVAGGLRLQTSTDGTTWVAGSGGGWSEDNNASNTSDWVKQEGEYTVQTGVKFIRLRVGTGMSAGTLYVDDASIQNITESKRLEAYANGVESRALSRGTDLVTNGTGYMGTNYNFSSFTFDPSDAPTGANGSFTYASSAYTGSRLSDEFIPIDLSKRYIISSWGREQAAGKTSRAYLGLAPYDGAGLAVVPYYYAHLGSTTTTLAADLKPGDTTVSLTSSANWSTTSPNNYLGIWNYVDKFGKLWPVGTYTRNVYPFNAVNGNTLALNTTYTGPVVPAGTSVSNMNSGGTYMYVTMTNALLTNTWTRYASTPVGGLHDGSNRSVASYSFPPGTASVRLLFLPNYSPGTAGSSQAFAGISISDAQAASYYANNITETQITDGAITTPKIATNAIDARTIAANAVTSNAILANSIIAGKIATDAVDADQIKANAITTVKIATDAIDARTVVAGAIGTVALAAEAVDATKIKANTITADRMAIGDTSNMATVNESVPGNGNFGVSKNIIVNGWSTRDRNDNIYFMFREKTGPLPFKTGDRIKISFEAYASTSVTGTTVTLYVYQGPTGSPVAQAIGAPMITTTAQTFSYEADVTVDTNLKDLFLIGLVGTGVTGRDIFVRNVRAYVMNAGELIVDGSIHGNKMITNTLDANVIKTSTLTSTTITIGTGGIIKTATGGVQITDSGIIIPSGHLDANVLKGNTAFVTTLNIGSGGAIQSTGYTSGGTTGFQLSNTGLVIKGSGNTIDASVIKGGTITGTTVNIGAGGTLNVDSTAVIKSNNYSSTTGYQLSSSGLTINDGSINAKTITSGTVSAATITLSGANGKIVGTGFSLSGSGLTVTSGSIAAAALNLQVGQNLVPPAYADFEFAAGFYGSNISTFFATATRDSTSKKFSNNSLKITWTGNSGASVWMGATDVDYNFDVDPSTSQIVSTWVSQTGTFPIAFVVKYETSAGSTTVTSANLTTPASGWGRVSAVMTPPANATGRAILGIQSKGTSSGQVTFIDGIQVEIKSGAVNTPSPWMPSTSTSIDGGMIKTNTITTEQIAAGAITAGSGIIADLAVTSAKIAGVIADKITSGSITAELGITSGIIVAGNIAGARTQMTNEGLRVYTIGPNGVPYEAVSMTNQEISFGVMGQDGSKLGGIGADGSVVGSAGSFSKGIMVRGTPLVGKADGGAAAGWLDNLSRGIVAIREIPSDNVGSVRGTGVEIPSYYLAANLVGGRRYRVVMSARFWGGVAGGVVVVRIRYNTGTTVPGISSPQLGYPADVTMATTTHTPTVQVEGIYDVPTSRRATFRMTFQGFYGAQPRRTGGRLYVEDVGPLVPGSVGSDDDGAGSTLYESVWKATASRGYDKNGATISGSSNKINTWFWGASPTQYNSAAWIYTQGAESSTDSLELGKTLSQALTGATIQKAEVYVRNKVWYNGAEGSNNSTGIISMNTLASATLPATKVVTPELTFDSIVEGEGVWLEVPTSWFTNGSVTGVTLGSSNAKSKDGSLSLTSGEFHGINDTDPPKLRITYTK